MPKRKEKAEAAREGSAEGARAMKNMQKRYSNSRSVGVYSILSGGVVSPGDPACRSGQVCILGLSFTARAYTRSNGAHHASRRGEPFSFALATVAGG